MSPKEIPDELIDRLLAGREGPEAIRGRDGLLKQLAKRVVERAASAELSEHLGYELGEEPPEGHSNRRNGSASKTLIADQGSVPVELPRDRDGSFEPQLLPKHQRRFAGFDDKIVSMYARGMSTREISKHLEEIYGVEVGRDTISRVTDAVLDDVKEWQARPLEKLYLVVWLDAIVLTCIVHMIRNSLRFTSYKDRKQLVKDLRMIYTAATEEAAQTGLETFAGVWDSRYPQISQSWRDAWEQVIPYFAFPPALRRAVYTTNQIESLNSVVRK